MIALLLACTEPAPSPDSKATVDSEPRTDSPADTQVERPRLSSPAEAEDLDPADEVLHVVLRAEPLGEGYAYNGQVPGPTLRLERGDRLVVELQNGLDSPTTLHWHGLHVPWAMDGATWMNDPVEPGESFEYSFTVDQVGTYWYHPHFDTAHQVDLGLYGVIVVEDPLAPETEELVVVFDSEGEIEPDGGPEGTGLSWTANGLLDPLYEATGALRVRLLNASNTGYVALPTPGRQLASDQGWLSEEVFPELLVLGPGDRVELEWTGDRELSTLPWTLQGGQALGEATQLLSVEGAGGTPADWPYTGEAMGQDPWTTDIVYVFQGGREGWMINGERFPDVTIERLAEGQDAVIELRNLSASHHPFHLHGMAFEVLSVDGVPPPQRSVQDTIDVGLYSIVRLRVEADNPGDWMAHCHILPHAEGGMMTVLRVLPED